jgi:hypothetical protein
MVEYHSVFYMVAQPSSLYLLIEPHSTKSRMMLCIQTSAVKSIVFEMKEFNDKLTISKNYYLACAINRGDKEW